jgi:hypothetical protein
MGKSSDQAPGRYDDLMKTDWQAKAVTAIFAIFMIYGLAANLTFMWRYPTVPDHAYRVYLVEVWTFQRVPELER